MKPWAREQADEGELIKKLALQIEPLKDQYGIDLVKEAVAILDIDWLTDVQSYWSGAEARRAMREKHRIASLRDLTAHQARCFVNAEVERVNADVKAYGGDEFDKQFHVRQALQKVYEDIADSENPSPLEALLMTTLGH